METNLKDIRWYGFLRSLPRHQLLLSVFYGGARILLSAAWPYLLYHFIQKRTGTSPAEIAALVLMVVAMFTLSGIASHRQSLLNISIMKDFSLSLTERMWQKMNRLDWLTFHGKNRVYFFDMLMVDAWRLRHGMIALLESMIVNTVIVGALTLLIMVISLPMFILCVAGLLITAGLHFYSTKKIRPYLKHFHHAWRDQHHWIAKSVDQFDLLKMGRAQQESAERNSINTTVFLGSNAAMLACQSKWRAINQVAGNIIRVIILITGMYWIQTGYLQVTSLLLILLIISIIQNNLSGTPAAIVNFMEGQEASASILEFFALPEEGQATLDNLDITGIETIDIRDLKFSYPGILAVNNIDIILEKGKIYLWQGVNGSGKSTTAHILLGLLQPQSGTLTINGESMEWDDLKKLRSRFAFVHQDAPMFMGTIHENVLFGHPEPEEAWGNIYNTWLAGLMPTGVQAGSRKVGERGEGLSGGEARRLALIREWVRCSDLIILDEPLNHLDDHAISEIKREIFDIKNNAIVIIISHQKGFETIADEIKRFG